MKILIFDLGGVIIPLDYSLVNQTLTRFASEAGKTYTPSELAFFDAPIFLQYEVGKLSSAEFRQGFRELVGLPALTDAQVDEAWNALLLPIPAERVRLLQELSKTNRIFLLSNTNEIHVKAVNALLQASTGLENLEMIFERTFYSHTLGLRKPHAEIYETVLARLGLPAHEVWFIDDNRANAEGASAVGIKTHWLDLSRETLLDVVIG